MVTVEARDAVQIQPRPEPAWRLAFKRWRENLQRRASGWLLSDLPHRPQVESRTSRRDALLQALLLGKREPSAQELDNRVRRVGLAHLLAISGLHLAILAGFVLMLVRFGGRERRWHGVIIIAIVLSYLALIDVRLPVLRAAVMICFGCLGLTFGRRAHAGGLVCLSAIVLLLWRPHQLFTPGFQLSFGVVLGLIYFAGPLRVRMFGSPNEVAATSGEMLGETLKTWIAAALTAWLISAPITMYHFGTIALYAVPLTILCLPLLAVILVLGFAKMICSLVLPSVGLIVGVPLSITADIFLAIVDGADAMPFATILTVKPSVVWIVLAFIVIAGIALARHWRVRRRFYWTAAALIVWIILRMLPIWPTPALRIDMLAVGNGSCYLVRSDHHAVLFDAGSGSDLDVGSNTIIPALRELGVRSLDAIVISHANLDHYCGVLDVVDGLPVKQIIITPQLQQAAMDDPASPIAFVLRRLNQQQLSQVAVSRGDQYMFGDAQWSWLHPARHDTFEHVNDKSMVIAVDAGYRRLLLTGDIQSEAIDALNQREPQLAADIIELPHHGSMNAEALGLVLDLDATVIMQSTGPRRLENDRWAEPLAAVERLITARDGAGWVEVDEQDTITLGRFVAE